MEETAVKYDRTKRYKWSQDVKFEFSAGEFGLILNALRQVLSTPEAQTILLASRASGIVEKALEDAVELGVAVEDKKGAN